MSINNENNNQKEGIPEYDDDKQAEQAMYRMLGINPDKKEGD
ncbi:MAG: hypothetical protein ACQEQD_04415 [Bacillota bacterium]